MKSSKKKYKKDSMMEECLKTHNPYGKPPVINYDMRAMVKYAHEKNKKVIDFTEEEAEMFRLQ